MYAVLFVPNFRLQVALRWREELDCKAVVIVDEQSTKSTVLECNEPALASGISSGMASPQALARCPQLTLLARAVAEEEIVQAILLEAAFSLSPEVEATAAGCCTIDLRKAAGEIWNAACPNLVARLLKLRLAAKIGVAPNPDLAFMAARRAAPFLVVNSPHTFLCQLAVAEIDPPADLVLLLRDWGIHTLGQLTALPRIELADRLGPDAHRFWQLAAGKTERLLRLVRPVEEFAEAFEFEGEIETVEPLYFVLRRFLDQLCFRLEIAHRVVAKMELSLALEDKTDHRRKFTIPSPTNESEALFRILCTYLDGLQLSQRLAGVRLQIEPVRPEGRQERLFDNPLRDPNKFGETLARIIALVGPENAGVVEMADTHRPDNYRLAPPEFHRLQEVPPGKAEDFSNGIPLRQFRPPFSARVNVEQGRPVQIFSEKAHGNIVDALGPYRASGGWWEKDAWGTEEWDVEVAGEGIFRISHSRGQLHSNGQWLIEGCYESAIH